MRTTGFTLTRPRRAGETLSDDVQCLAGRVAWWRRCFAERFLASQPNTIVTTSRPLTRPDGPVNGDEPTGWFAAARHNADTAIQTVTVYVLCASAA